MSNFKNQQGRSSKIAARSASLAEDFGKNLLIKKVGKDKADELLNAVKEVAQKSTDKFVSEREKYLDTSDVESMKFVLDAYNAGVAAVAERKWANFFQNHTLYSKVLYEAYHMGIDDMEDSLLLKIKFVPKSEEEIIDNLN